VNEKHLLWHIFQYLDEYVEIDINDMIEGFAHEKRMFSKESQPNEISVASALTERWDAYNKARQNG
jgi:hypothetical protein